MCGTSFEKEEQIMKEFLGKIRTPQIKPVNGQGERASHAALSPERFCSWAAKERQPQCKSLSCLAVVIIKEAPPNTAEAFFLHETWPHTASASADSCPFSGHTALGYPGISEFQCGSGFVVSRRSSAPYRKPAPYGQKGFSR